MPDFVTKIYRNDDCVADLAISKTVVPTTAVAGENITYTLLITNVSGITALNAALSDTLPPSVTLRVINQRDDSRVNFSEGVSQNLRWYDPRPNSDDNREWLELSSGSATGVFTSRVMDAQNVVSWTSITWNPRRPYLTPLPDNRAAESDYTYGNVDMTGNRLLLHLDDSAAPFSDTSGLDNHGVCGLNCPAGAAGRFNQALAFDASLSQSVVISDAYDPIRYAIEAWVYPTSLTDTAFILRTDAAGDTTHHSHLLGIVNGHFQHTLFDGERKTISATAVTTNTWYHLLGTAESNGDMKLFVNGVEVAKRDGIGDVWSGGSEYRLGVSYQITRTEEVISGTVILPPIVVTDTSAYFSGRLDEAAVYSRTLSAGEALDHYLRGALRLGFQARSCDDPACDGEAFVGPGGNSTAYYHDAGATPPPVSTLDGVADNRYFQYRAVFESDALSPTFYTPQLTWVQIGPTHRMVEASQGACAATAGDFTCDLGDVGAGITVTVIAYGVVDSNALGVITNTASVTASNDITDANNSAIVTATVGSEVGLYIRKYDDDHDDDYNRDWDYGAADPVNPGSVMTYILQIHNDGPSDAWNAQISDTLPITVSGWMTEGNWNPTCSLPASNVISCTVASLRAHSWQRLIITGTAPLTDDGVTITNTAWITAPGSAVYTTSRISDTEETLITSLADLVILKSAAPDPVNPGEIITFTITVSNSGPSTATNVILTDTLFLPAGLTGTVVGPLAAGCSPASGSVIVCGPAMIPIPAGMTVTFQITAAAPVSGVIGNRVEVASDTYDPDEENNIAEAYAGVLPVADLHIVKADVEDPVLAGGSLTYTLTVSNSGYVNAGERSGNLTFGNHRRIYIPWGGAAHPYPSSIYVGGMEGLIQNITVTLNALGHTFPADIEAVLVGPGGQSVILMANAGGGVDADDVTLTIADSGAAMPLNAALTDTVVYRPTNRGFSGDMPPPAPSGPYGGSLSAFNNSSPNGEWQLYVYDTFGSDRGDFRGGWDLQIAALTTDTVTISDTLPIELSGVSVAPPAGWTRIGSDPLMYQTDAFPLGAYQVFTITAAAPTAGGVITNTAAITATVADTFPDSNRSVITTTINPSADLGVVKQVSPADEVLVGDPLTYTLTVSNAGPSNIQSVVTVMDWLPNGLTNITATAGCTLSAAPLITCILPGGLNVGAEAKFTITASAPITAGVVANTASITSATGDPDPGNNTGVVTLSVVAPSADLSIVKQVSPADEVLVGDPLTYTLTVNNAGPHATGGVVTVTDRLPDGLTNVNAPGCAVNVPLITCTLSGGLAVGAEANFTITARVSSTASVVANTAWITSATGDPNPGNNSDTAVVVVNHAPIFTSTPIVLATAGKPYTYNIVAIDPDPGDALTITAPTRPAWLAFNDNGGGLAALDGAPAEVDIGDHPVELVVVDSGGLTDTQRFTITVSPGTYAIYLPVIMKNYAVAPDLVVDTLIVAQNSITVVIKNQGAAPVEYLFDNEFWVDVYINPSVEPTYNQTWEHLSSQGLVWGVTQSALPLNVGDVITLTVGDAYYRADKSNVAFPLAANDEVWAQVDSNNRDTDYGAVKENHEIVGGPYNNVNGAVFPTSVGVMATFGNQAPISAGLPPRPLSE